MLIRLCGGRLLSVCLWKAQIDLSSCRKWFIIGPPLTATPNQDLPSIYVEKIQIGERNSQELLRVPSWPPCNGADFASRGRAGHFMSSCKQIWKSIRNEHKIIAWSYWPYVYAEWLSKYSLRMRSGGGGEMSPRKSVVQSACQYEVTSCVSNFQNGEQSVHRRDG